MNRSRRSLCLWIIASLTLIACTEDEAPLGPCNGKACPEECTALSAQGACDVYEPECQERVLRAVGCVRGEEGVMPPIRVLTEEEHQAEDELMNQPPSIDAGAGDAGDADTDAAAPPAFPTRVHERALELFGLSRERERGSTTARLGGYYRGMKAGVTLIDHGEPGDSAKSQRNLAHELVHAYQDQQLGLFSSFGALAGPSADASLMFNCLVEGEARLYEMLAWGLLTDTPLDEAFVRDTYAYDLSRARTIIATEGAPEKDLPLICYGLGGTYLLGVWLAGGNPAIRAQHAAPTVNSVRWMRGVAGRSEARWDSSERGLACTSAAPPDGYLNYPGDSLGALRMFAFLSSRRELADESSIEQSWEQALEWQRDSFEVFVGPAPEYEIAAAWRIRLTTPELARELERELADAGPELVVHAAGAELELRAAESAEVLEAWSDFESCGLGF